MARYENYHENTPKKRAGPGRPPTGRAIGTRMEISLSKLRALHGDLSRMRNNVHKLPKLSLHTALSTILTELERIVGPRLDPNWKPEPIKSAKPEYRVSLPDGDSVTVATVPEAAALYGCAPTSLRAMLARGKGKARGWRVFQGTRVPVAVVRLYPDSAQPDAADDLGAQEKS